MSLFLSAALAMMQVGPCAEAETQLEMNRCAAADYRAADERLNAAWDELPEEARARLRPAQRAWTAYRDAECDARGEAYVGGSIRPLVEANCLAELTAARTEDLRAAASPDTAQAETIRIGDSYRLYGVDEMREVNVVLPAGYSAEPDREYPVLYLIDGGRGQDLLHVAGTAHLGAMWGRSADAIVVGIETKDRQRELLPATTDPAERERWPTAGDSAVFRQFIADEVKPLIEDRYRTSGVDAVIGESAAGHFILETWLTSPALFGAYAAISPSLQWSEQALSRGAAGESLSGMPPLFLARANEGGAFEAGIERLAEALPEGEQVCINRRPDLYHGTIYHALTPEALQFILPGPEPLPPQLGMTVNCEN